MHDYIIHSGVGHDDNPPGRGSGRFEWGSGENPGQHQFNFLSEVKKLRSSGITDTNIAKMLLGDKATTTDLRAEISIHKSKERRANREKVVQLYEKYGNKSEVGRIMGLPESTVRSLLDPVIAERTDRYEATANMLKEIIKKKGVIDVGKDVEIGLGVTEYTKKVAINMLRKEGYVRTYVKIPQLGTNNETNTMVLAPPGTEWKDIQKNKFEIASIQEYSPDKGKTWLTTEYPSSVNSDRVWIRYGDDGGKDKDGVIELRRGVEDISLGQSQYAQVRIAVNDSHFMKGMAIYSDDIPKGYDIVYNTNKKSGTPKEDVFKKFKTVEATGEIDRDNPFGALIKAGGQRHYIDKDGNDRLSPINKIREEGDWQTWSKTLSAQFLSKQPLNLINQQLRTSLDEKRLELEEIKSLTNPVIKQKLLGDFARLCDTNASELYTKGFKKQCYKVILPVNDLKDNEVYDPSMKNGEMVALIRYPHGGLFEIPILKVNNNHKNAKAIVGNAVDAIGINSTVAGILSGADFDGDFVIRIPLTSNNISVKRANQLEGLKDFDTKIYALPDDAPKMKNSTKQRLMGETTNLITDMTVQGATMSEITRAVRHSMVVIDAEKHHLDYKQSAQDNNISALREKYQNGKTGGASTILSRAAGDAYVYKRKQITDTSKMTPEELKRWEEGKIVWRDTGETMFKRNTRKDGTVEFLESRVTERVNQMDTVDDAMMLVRDKNNPKEVAYANYANDLKNLANEARREYRSITPTPVNQSAKRTYASEVESLNAKLRLAKSNSPMERQAQAVGNKMYSEIIRSNPSMDSEHRSREKARCLTKARAIVGASRVPVVITDREWEAIQANAISTNKLKAILDNTDQNAFKERATPRKTQGLTNAQINFIISLSGRLTQSEIAERLGISASTVSSVINNAK